LLATQTWPALKKPPPATLGTANSKSASAHTIHASFPANSSVTFFSVRAQLSMTLLPVAIVPVKLILAMPGCSVMRAPRSAPPFSTWNTPGGSTPRLSSTHFMTA
jgi:hypothetical protein